MSPELVTALRWALSMISRCLDRDRERDALMISILIEHAVRGGR